MNAPLASVREQVSAEEWKLRVDLAACYRLVALHGWDDTIFTHISARLPGPDHHFLINPYGMMFDEITASSLVKIDLDGNPVMASPYSVNYAGFIIHSTIHAAREDVVCVLHTHTPAGIAVSAQAHGLLPISQQATVVLGSLSYHDYEGIAVRDEERVRLTADLGTSMSLILRNHGLLTVGTSVGDAFQRMFSLQRACEAQVMALAGGTPLVLIGQDILDGVHEAVTRVRQGLGNLGPWPALLRKLDRHLPGYDV